MSLSQFTLSQETTSGINAIDESAVSAIEGSKSLRFRHGGAGGKVAGLTIGMNVTTGLVRAAFTLTSEGDSANVDRAVGVFGMMQGSVAYNSNAYWARVTGTAGANPFFTGLALYKGTADSGTNFTGTSITFNKNKDAVFTLALHWSLDATTNHVLLRGYYGAALDYSDLTLFATYTDSISAYTTTVSSGLGAYGGGGDQSYRADVAEFYK